MCPHNKLSFLISAKRKSNGDTLETIIQKGKNFILIIYVSTTVAYKKVKNVGLKSFTWFIGRVVWEYIKQVLIW